MAKNRINIRLSEEVTKKLDELCDIERRDRSNMIEVLIVRQHEELIASQRPTENETTTAQQG